MICNTCNQEKSTVDFPKSPGTKLGIRRQCKSCYAKKMRDYYKKNPEQYVKHKAYVRRNDKEYCRQWTRHGLSETQFTDMLCRYQGRCWSCKTKPACVVDHDHACCSGAWSCGYCVRGILCIGCNSILGFAEDRTEYLEAAIEYLREYRPDLINRGS